LCQIPSMCQGDWVCPGGHVCNAITQTKVRSRPVSRTFRNHCRSLTPSLPRPSHSNSSQVLCGLGTFALNGTCELCPRGRFSSVVGAAECARCPLEAPFSPLGATSQWNCTSCATGCDMETFGAVWSGVDCPAGHACNSTSSTMVACFGQATVSCIAIAMAIDICLRSSCPDSLRSRSLQCCWSCAVHTVSIRQRGSRQWSRSVHPLSHSVSVLGARQRAALRVCVSPGPRVLLEQHSDTVPRKHLQPRLGQSLHPVSAVVHQSPWF
jgi:hypothetical protein